MEAQRGLRWATDQAPAGTIDPTPGPAPDAAPGAAPDDHRPRRRWRRAALGGAAALTAALLLVPTSVVDGLAADRVADLGGDCADLVGVDVHSGPWPVAARLLATGRYHDVAADIDEVRLRDPALTYDDVTFTADRIDVGALGGLLGDGIRVHGGTTTATLAFDSVEALLEGYGVTAELAEDAGAIRADVVVPFLGEVPTTVHVAATPDGAVELRFVPLDLVELPPVRIDVPAPTRVTAATVTPGGVDIEASVEGTIPRDEFTCDV